MIIHSPVISGSMTFASGSTVTYPEGGVYSGSFSGSFQGDGSSLTFGGTDIVSGSSQVTESLDLRYVNLTESASLSITGSFSGSVNVTSDNLVINGGTFTDFSSSVSSSIGGISTDFGDFSGNVTASAISASELVEVATLVTNGAIEAGSLIIDDTTFTANNTSNMVGVGTTTPSNPFALGDQTFVVNSTVGNTTGILQLQNNGNGEITIYGYAGSAIIQPSGSMDLVLYADNGNKGLTLGANGTASMDMHLLPDANVTYDLGSPTKRWRDIYLSGNTMNLGGNKITSDESGLNFSDADGNPVGLTTGEIIVSGSGGTVSLGIDEEGNLSQTNTATGVSGSSAKINETDGTLPYRSGSNFGDSVLSQNGSTLTIAGNLVPDNTSRTLGTEALPFQDLYLSSASLYINGQQVLSTDGTELTIQTDAGESLKLLETGADTITLQTANGDITLTSTGNGNIELDAPVQIAAGKNILSSDGNAISFANDIDLDTNKIFAANLANVVSGSQQVIDLLPTGTVSGSTQITDGSGIVSGSVQVLGGSGILSASGETFAEFSSSVSSSFAALSPDYNDLLNIPSGIVSSSAIAYSGNDVTVLGNLTVQGTQTQLNTTALNVEDINILIASGAANSAAADGAGITIDGADVTFNWSHASTMMELSSDLAILDGDLLVNRIQPLSGGDVTIYTGYGLAIDNEKLKIGGTLVTSTAAELNLLDTAVAGTIVNSKAVVYGAAGEVNATKLQVGGVDITSTPAELNLLDGVSGLVQADFTKLAAVDATAEELNLVDGSSAGTVVNSKAVVYGSAGEVNATKLQVGGVDITSTPAELNLLDGVSGLVQADFTKLAAVDVTAAEINYLDGVSSNIQTQLDDKIALTAISATDDGGDGSFSYDNTTGVFTYTGPSATEVRAHFSGGTGVTISSGEISIGQSVGTSDNVTFGNVNGATGTFTGDVIAYASSDERLKDNIEVISNPIEKVQQLKGVTWDWNDNADELQKSLPNVGVIAQDVEKVLPQVVKDRENGFKGVDYDKIVGLLIEAIKDQQSQIDELKAQLK